MKPRSTPPSLPASSVEFCAQCMSHKSPRSRLLIWPTTGLNEYFSGFDNIGHNNLMQLIFLWIIPK